MTLLIPKKHYDSDLFNIDDEFYVKYFLTAKKIVQLLKK
jgi:diadenosine tetraphosphate (Ap4A) HIT family hydrolase